MEGGRGGGREGVREEMNDRTREKGVREREGRESVLYGLVKCDESCWQKTIWSNWTNRRKELPN